MTPLSKLPMSIKQLAFYGKKNLNITDTSNHPSITSTFKNKYRILRQPVGGAPLHISGTVYYCWHICTSSFILKVFKDLRSLKFLKKTPKKQKKQKSKIVMYRNSVESAVNYLSS